MREAVKTTRCTCYARRRHTDVVRALIPLRSCGKVGLTPRHRVEWRPAPQTDVAAIAAGAGFHAVDRSHGNMPLILAVRRGGVSQREGRGESARKAGGLFMVFVFTYTQGQCALYNQDIPKCQFVPTVSQHVKPTKKFLGKRTQKLPLLASTRGPAFAIFSADE